MRGSKPKSSKVRSAAAAVVVDAAVEIVTVSSTVSEVKSRSFAAATTVGSDPATAAVAGRPRRGTSGEKLDILGIAGRLTKTSSHNDDIAVIQSRFLEGNGGLMVVVVC